MHRTASRHPRFLEIALVQVTFLLLLSLLMDGKVMATAYAIPLIAYWGSVIVLSIRKLCQYSPRDVAYINRAWVVIIPLGMAAVLLSWWVMTGVLFEP